jgi:hypothetical protein
MGTGSTAIPTANAKVEFAPLGSSTPILLSTPPVAAPARLYHIVGTND